MIDSPSIEAVHLARRQLALEQRKAQLRRENELEFFNPHSKQSQFFWAARFRRRYARTGNRFGKSEMGAAEDVAFAIGYRPWVDPGITFRSLGLTRDIPEALWDVPLRTLGIPKNPTKGLIVTTDWDKSTEIFTSRETGANQGKLFKYIPKNRFVEATKNHSGAIDRIVVRHISGGNSVIHLDTVKSFKQNPLGQESSAWDWAHIDEPCPEAMWKAIARGLVDRNGSAWFTCTPLTEPWIDAKFIPDIENQSKDLEETVSSNDHWMMTGSMYDNPYNTPEAIAIFLSELTEDERECRIAGIPASYSGLVYKEFKWNTHVRVEPPVGWKSWAEPPATYTLRYAIDYHPRKPNAVLFIATSPDEISYVYAELWTPSLLDEFVAEIKRICPVPTVPSPIDPLASTPNKVTDLTFMDELQNRGLPLIPATKDPANGIIKTKQLLALRQKDAALPVLVFNASCRRTLFEIARGFIWDEDTDKPVKKNDDMMENLGRLVLQGLYYLEPSTSNDYLPVPSTDLENVLELPDLSSGPSRESVLAQKRRIHSLRYRK